MEKFRRLTRFSSDVTQIFIDQPLGTGFSYGNVRRGTEEELAEDAYWALQNFLKYYPQFANLPLYITGESYVRYVLKILKSMRGNSRLTEDIPRFFFRPVNISLPLATTSVV